MRVYSIISLLLFVFIGGLFGQVDFQVNGIIRSFNDDVNSFELDQESGKLYVGGAFTTYGGSYNGIDVFPDSTMLPSRMLPWIPEVDEVVTDGSGGWIIGTRYVEGIDVSPDNDYHFIHIHPDMSYEDLPYFIPSTFNGIQLNGLLRHENLLIFYYDFKLFIIDWLTGEIKMDINLNSGVNCAAITGEELIVGGSFSTVNGVARNLVCSFSLTDFELTSFSPNASSWTSPISAYNCTGVAISDDYYYFMLNYNAGYPSYGTVSDIVRVDPETNEVVTEIVTLLDANANLNHHNDKIFYTGKSNLNGIQITRVFSFDDNEEYPNADLDYLETRLIHSLYFEDGLIYLAGDFVSVDGIARVGNAIVQSDDFSLVDAHIPFNGTNVKHLHFLPGANSYLLTTDEDMIGGYQMNYFAVLDANTGVPVNNDLVILSAISDMKLSHNGDTLFLAGSNTISEVYGQTKLIAVDLSDMSVINWVNSTPPITDIDIVNGSLFIQFTSQNGLVNGQGRSRIASFDLQTLTLDPVFINVGGRITGFLELGDTLFVAGLFTDIGGLQRKSLAMLNKNDYSVLNWDCHIETMDASPYNSVVKAGQMLCIDNKLFVSGYFGPSAGYTGNTCLAAFNLQDASRYAGYHVPVTGNLASYNNLLQRGQQLFIGGGFGSGAPYYLKDIAIYDLGTNQFLEWTLELGNSSTVNDFVIYGNSLIIGGNFISYNGNTDYASSFSLDIGCMPPMVQLPQVVEFCNNSNSVINSSWEDSNPDSYEWQYSDDGGINWHLYENEGSELLNGGASLIYTGIMELHDSVLVRVLASNDCGVAYSNSTIIVLTQNELIGAYVNDNDVCIGSTLLFNSPIEVMWSDGISTGLPFVTTAVGDFIAIATAINGCYEPDSVTYHVSPGPQLNVTILDSLNCEGGPGIISLSGSGGQAPYSFYLGTTLINSIYFNANGQQEFTIRDANYCSTTVVPTIPYSQICFGCMDPEAMNYNEAAIFEEYCYYSLGNCNYDLNGDYLINVQDVLVLIENFGCYSNCIGDVDDDGLVGTSDIILIVSELGWACQP